MNNAEHDVTTRRLLRERDICAMLDVSRVSIWNWRRRGVFPAPVRVGTGRYIRWRVEDIEAWLTSRPAA